MHIYQFIISYIIAPSSVPTVSLVNTNTTSVTIKWTAVSDANGYVVYINDTAHSVIQNDTNITVDGLIPGTDYAITVRAYQDVLGPPSTTFATTIDGKFECATLLYSLCS